MKDNALAIGVSSLEFTNILCSYYPKGIKENFDIKVKVLKTDRTQMINDEELKAEKNPIEEKLLQLQREIEELKNK